MSKLREALESGQFALVVELKPPKGTAVVEMLAPLPALQGRVTAFGAPDNEQACLRLSALAACRLIQEGGGEPLLHLACRDRNRLALESDLLGSLKGQMDFLNRIMSSFSLWMLRRVWALGLVTSSSSKNSMVSPIFSRMRK